MKEIWQNIEIDANNMFRIEALCYILMLNISFLELRIVSANAQISSNTTIRPTL